MPRSIHIVCSALLCSIILFPAFLFAQDTEGIYQASLESKTEIFVVTNRMETDKGEPSLFLNEVRKSKDLVYRKATFFQPDSLNTVELDSSAFFKAMLEKDGDWLLFVHGDSKTFKQAVMRGYDIQYLHKVNVIVFSWPSRDPDLNGVKNFKNSKMQVVNSLDHFHSLMYAMQYFEDQLDQLAGSPSLSMFIHSLGNAYLENLVAKQQTAYKLNSVFDNVILNAAAVNQENHKDWVEQLEFQERLYITCNKQDFNLKGVRIFTKDGKQLGEKIEAPLAEQAQYVHFSKAVGFRFPTGTTHTYFIGEVPDESANIRLFYTELVHGDPPDLDKSDRFEKREDGLGYDIVF